MLDLNDLRIFAYVASLASFSSAADALQIHKSSVSRSISRLEKMLQTSLIHRTTRKVLLTEHGIQLKERCVEMLSRVNETIGYAGRVDPAPMFAARPSPAIRSRPKLVAAVDRKPRRVLGGLSAF
ncbi:LysR family transcriptional regulator [Variovorax saccharolyticus]|uniref:LysR family transcriptional regulator n=1 Tax=Variovorax saccharolyticus TaxID=3053516 RepID=UPI0025770ECB|nr:LysR family transcriptional regulator [Variovorax sp. J22R187]MDM0020706.1 LysR family transcriptional regulator [Variovorax sp. J22R187]